MQNIPGLPIQYKFNYVQIMTSRSRLERKFVPVIGIPFMKIKEEINTYLLGYKFFGKGGPQNPRTLVSHEQ
jgi:hypothetical protein